MTLSGRLTLNRPTPASAGFPATAKQPRAATVSAQSGVQIKVPLNASEVAAAFQPFANAAARVPIMIRLEGWRLTAAFTPKAIRKVLALLQDHGPERVVIFVQGKLGQGDQVLGAGLVTQLKPLKQAAIGADPLT
jgi:hypothetical protein